MNKTLVSFLMPCRNKGNGPRTIYDFLNSVMDIIPKEDLSKMEFLIKFDTDDSKQTFEKYPLKIKTFVFNRWEGYNTLYLIYQYLFSKRDQNSRFVIHASDDSVIKPEARYFLQDLEKIKDKYSIINAVEIPHTIEKLEKVRNYRNTSNLWATGFLTEPYPVISTRIIEIMGNFGWQPCADATFALLNIIMYAKYGINLVQTFNYRHIDRIDNPIKSREVFKSDFNEDMKINDSEKSTNDYIYVLTERQVDSIYFNMKYEQ